MSNYIHAYTGAYIRMYIYIYICTYVCIHMHIRLSSETLLERFVACHGNNLPVLRLLLAARADMNKALITKETPLPSSNN